MKKSSIICLILFPIMFFTGANTVFAYDIIEYFSKDVEDFKVYGEYVKESDRGKKFLSIVFVAHVHHGDDPSDRNKVIQAYHNIYESLIKDRWIYESRQGKEVGTVTIDFVNNSAWTEIDIEGMDKSYRIKNNNYFEERILRKLNKEIRGNGHTGIRHGVYVD